MRRMALRLLAVLAGSALALVAAELVAAWTLPPARAATLRRHLAADPAGVSLGPHQSPEVLHPYLGYVAAPGSPDPGETAAVNPLGFHGLDPRTPRPEGVARVALVGGSVAKGQVDADGGRLASKLEALPRFRGRRVELVRLALGGYKQPQGLHAVAHVLSLGAELDLVVALDGFNEVALPPVHAVPVGASPVFPRDWALRAGAAPGLLDATALAALEASREHRRALRRWLRPLVRAGSHLALRLFAALDARAARTEARHHRALARDRAAVPAALRGPGPIPADVPGALSQAVATWERSSRLLHQLCRARGIGYVHLLQPNQYDPTVTPWDGPTWRADSPMRPGARLGYPLLREAGERLRAAGVAFHDLGGLFGADAAASYGDDCCHYSERGIRAVSDALVEAVAGLERPALRPAPAPGAAPARGAGSTPGSPG